MDIEFKKKNNKTKYVLKGFIIFLMLVFGSGIGSVLAGGHTTQEEYDILDNEYQTKIIELNKHKEELKELKDKIQNIQTEIDSTKSKIEMEY